jgi:hypothetical protein
MAITFNDNFNDNSIDTAKWDETAAHLTYHASVTVVETGQLIEITPRTSVAGSNHNGLRADNAVDFTRGYCQWEVRQIAGADVNAQTRCGIILDASNLIEFMVANTTLTFRQRASGSNSDTTLAYNSTTHRWMRLWHDGTNIYFDTSPDGTTWTNRRTVAAGITLTSVKVYIMAGTEGSVTTPGVAKFDNVAQGNLTVVAPFEQVIQQSRFVVPSCVAWSLDLDIISITRTPTRGQIYPRSKMWKSA